MTDKKKKNILELTRMTPEECRASGKLPLMVLLDNVRSLNNVGAILRTADAFSVQQVVMCGITGTPPQRRFIRQLSEPKIQLCGVMRLIPLMKSIACKKRVGMCAHLSKPIIQFLCKTSE